MGWQLILAIVGIGAALAIAIYAWRHRSVPGAEFLAM